MLRVVLPAPVTASSTASRGLGGDAIAPVYVVSVATIDVRVAVVIVIVVDRDIVVAAPAAAPAPASAHRRPHGNSDSEGDRHPGRVVSRRRIGDWRIRVGWRTVNNGGIIAGDVNNLWVRLLDDDDLLGLHNFRFHLLLLI
jgi:hypothetical protein